MLFTGLEVRIEKYLSRSQKRPEAEGSWDVFETETKYLERQNNVFIFFFKFVRNSSVAN